MTPSKINAKPNCTYKVMPTKYKLFTIELSRLIKLTVRRKYSQ